MLLSEAIEGLCIATRAEGRAPWTLATYREKGCAGPVYPYAFGHGFARFYLLSGGDLGTLADILGHSTVEVKVVPWDLDS